MMLHTYRYVVLTAKGLQQFCPILGPRDKVLAGVGDPVVGAPTFILGICV